MRAMTTVNGLSSLECASSHHRRMALKRAAWPMLIVAGLALSGCESAGTVGAIGLGVAETTPKSQETSVNLASLSEVVARNPQDAEAYNTRGAAYARTGDFDKAIADFTKAIQLDPNNAAAFTNRALAYRQTGHNDLALADFNHAIQANPNHAPAYLGRGNLLRVQGNYTQALADLDQAIRLNPEGQLGAQAFHARGLIHQRQGDQPQAVTDFDNAIDRDPFAAAPYQARAQSLVAQGKYDLAIEDYNAALNVNAKNGDAWAGLGLAYEKSGNVAKARESYGRAKLVDPDNRAAAEGLSRLGA